MPPLTALLHTHNDALRLARALEMLVPCDEILVVDHDSHDGTVQVARSYGARVIQADPSTPMQAHLGRAVNDWIFCLLPAESISEALQASLYELKLSTPECLATTAAFSVFVREETADGWLEHPTAETRLVPRSWSRWQQRLPQPDASAIALQGEILRFSFP